VSNESCVRAILTEDILKWEKVLANFPRRSIVIFLVGNEFYGTEIFKELDRFESISVAFVQYLPDAKSKVPFKFICRTLIETPSICKESSFWKTLKTAFETYLRMKKLKLKTETYLLPLGYTNRFIDELSLLIGMAKGVSVLEGLPRINGQKIRESSIFFMGQRGSWLRRKIVNDFRVEKEAKIFDYAGWGGGKKSNSTAYIQLLLTQKYCLCPPGNLANDTPRYYEAISLGSLPILSRVSIQDWIDYDHWPKVLGCSYSHATIRDIHTKLEDLTNTEFNEALTRILSHERDKIRKLRELIWLYLGRSE
jgi:hypothetical protein